MTYLRNDFYSLSIRNSIECFGDGQKKGTLNQKNLNAYTVQYGVCACVLVCVCVHVEELVYSQPSSLPFSFSGIMVEEFIFETYNLFVCVASVFAGLLHLFNLFKFV